MVDVCRLHSSFVQADLRCVSYFCEHALAEYRNVSEYSYEVYFMVELVPKGIVRDRNQNNSSIS